MGMLCRRKANGLQLLGTYLVRYIGLRVHPFNGERAGWTHRRSVDVLDLRLPSSDGFGDALSPCPLVRLPCLGHPTAQRMW